MEPLTVVFGVAAALVVVVCVVVYFATFNKDNVVVVMVEEKTVDEETAIRNAVDLLDQKNEEHWAYFGQSRQRPSIEAIEEILGYHPDFHVLLEVWHKIQEEK